MFDIIQANHVNGVCVLPKVGRYGTDEERDLESVIKGLFGVQRLSLSDDDLVCNDIKTSIFTDELTRETLHLMLIIRVIAGVASKNMLVDVDLKKKLLNDHIIRVYYNSASHLRCNASLTPIVQICPMSYLSASTYEDIKAEAASGAPSIWIMAGFGRHDGTSTYRFVSIEAVDNLSKMPEETRELPSKLQCLDSCSRCGSKKMQRPCPACKYTHFCLKCWKLVKNDHITWQCRRIRHMMTQPSNEEHLYFSDN